MIFPVLFPFLFRGIYLEGRKPMMKNKQIKIKEASALRQIVITHFFDNS